MTANQSYPVLGGQTVIVSLISYTWENWSKLENVVVNSHLIEVAANLAAGLHEPGASTSPIKSLKLWVDALCINQNDLAGWSQEVKRMSDIYS